MMGVNQHFDFSTAVAPTGTPRQWRVQFKIEKDGVQTVYNMLFPDDIQQMVADGYLTNAEVKRVLLDVCMRAARRKQNIDGVID